jgi:NAD(P)-dependent dehydrogenase (short-subunit alcohol dehydrogenase family)
MKNKDIQNQTVLITGIGRGIGRALAERFLIEGHKVIGTIREESIDFTHPNLIVHNLDLSKPESIEKCANDILRLNIDIDIMINNAGALFDEEETTLIVEKLRKTLEVNLIGTADFTERLLTNISVGGHIINISSSAGSLEDTDMEDAKTSHYPFHYPAYKISKCALNMYTRTLAMRMERDGKNQGGDMYTRVSSIHPGWVKTQMGGEEADFTPEEAAEKIYKFAITRPETGQFWFDGKKREW